MTNIEKFHSLMTFLGFEMCDTMKIFINAGHDKKYDSGAVNQTTGLREADVAFDVGMAVKGYLEKAGCTVEIMQSCNLAGEEPRSDRLPSVCGTANSWGADIFVSIHCNSFSDPAAHGTETLIYRKGSEAEKIARCIQRQIVDSLGTTDRGIKEFNGIVHKNTEMPAVLVEMAFISNPQEEKLLRYRKDDFARAIARGITDYQQSKL